MITIEYYQLYNLIKLFHTGPFWMLLLQNNKIFADNKIILPSEKTSLWLGTLLVGHTHTQAHTHTQSNSFNW